MFLNFHISNTGTTQKCPYVFSVEKSIAVETSIQYSIQKYDHLTADRVMTANIKSLVFYVIMTPFPFYKNMLNFSGWSCSYKNGALLAKFQPGVFNPFVLICGCLLYARGLPARLDIRRSLLSGLPSPRREEPSGQERVAPKYSFFVKFGKSGIAHCNGLFCFLVTIYLQGCFTSKRCS